MSVPGVNITGPTAGYESILTPEAVRFLAILHRTFEPTRQALLARRQEEQARLDAGGTLDFLPETAAIRADKVWQGAAPGPGLADRRVEITGPVDRKMVINALNGGSATYMADFEDSNAPTWSNNMNGQINLRDAVRREIAFKQGEKEYKLKEKIATLIVRPRGWHLDEAHFTVDGQPISGGIYDFALYFFHNARETVQRGFGPYFYLPKMEHYLEVRLWNDIFKMAQDYIGIPRGTIRATILIETIPAAFQMEEFIFEIKEHSAGLNCGRWDYIFSFIKKFRHNPAFVLPDRADVTMTVPFMASYVKLLVQTCHTRGVAAMGGMSAQIPIKGDPVANDAVMDKVRSDKLREVTSGHDGTWVAHPALIPVALAIFDEHMPGPNQYYRRREDVRVSARELIDPAIPNAAITEKGVRENLSAALQYCANWASGNGCVPINHLMEDAATAEIARVQVWQWVRHGARTAEGQAITADWIDGLLEQETEKAKATTAKALDPVKVDVARRYLAAQTRAANPDNFLTSGLTEDLLSTSSSKL